MSAVRSPWSRLRRRVEARSRPVDDRAIDDRAVAGAPAVLPEEPLVSVVVPMYQVESWLAESLDSLVAQTYSNLEVVLVDDGSTDRTAEIAREYVDRDPRFQLVQQPNAGLGAARNTGLRHLSGDLVAFLDSDDTVPPAAYRTMVRTLQKSGSDFVVGSFERDDGGQLRARDWAREVHSRQRLATNLDEHPEIVANVFAWTKMFRREFLERIGLQFPEGVHYEDQVPSAQAYLQARAFDVIRESVYVWRKRDDGTSITQQKADLGDLEDRMSAIAEISEMLVGRASDRVRAHWYAKVLRLDLMGYMKLGIRADDDYFGRLSGRLARLLARAPDELVDHVTARFRVAAWLTAHGRRDALRRLLEYDGFVTSNFPTTVVDGELHADLGFIGPEVDVPRELLLLRPVDRRLLSQLTELDWSQPGRLEVSGVAVVRHVSPAAHRVDVALTAAAPGLGGLTVAASPRPDALANVFAQRVHQDHAGSAFGAAVDLSELVGRCPAGRLRATWEVAVTSTALGHVSTHGFDECIPHGSAVTPRSVLVDGALVTGRWVEQEGLKLDVRRRFAALRGVRPDGAHLVLDVETSSPAPPAELLVSGRPVPSEVTPHPDGGRGHLVKVAAADLAGQALPAELALDIGVPRPAPLRLAAPQEALDTLLGSGLPVTLGTHADAVVRVVAATAALLVDDVEFAGDQVEVSGRALGLDAFSLALVGPRSRPEAVEVTARDGRFRAVLPTTVAWWDGAVVPVASNAYRLLATVRPPAASAGTSTVTALAGRVRDESRPRPGSHGWSVEVTGRGAVRLRRGKVERPETLSAYAQQRLREEVYEPARSAPRTLTVLLESFGGALCGDSPRAVFDLLSRERPDLDLVWSVKDVAVPVPEGGRGVMQNTSEWWRLLGSARYLVNNGNFAPRFRKAPGQVYLQTWHGTPLKRIGLDMASQGNFNDSYVRLMRREAASWDYLLSPSPYCTGIFPRAFGYRGEVLELGYPRNDLLARPDPADSVRRQVRRELGVPDTHTVLLYAPTFRENARQGASFAKVLHLDAALVVERRPDVTVLVRGHANTWARASAGQGDRVIDVTAYPELGRLFLASDLLVTDYSSVFFDYALTDRPVLFLVPDLADYRDRLRGFYVDLDEVAPGPLLSSTEEVLEHLDDDPAAYADRRRDLRDRFTPMDDGAATERLVGRVFAPDTR